MKINSLQDVSFFAPKVLSLQMSFVFWKFTKPSTLIVPHAGELPRLITLGIQKKCKRVTLNIGGALGRIYWVSSGSSIHRDEPTAAASALPKPLFPLFSGGDNPISEPRCPPHLPRSGRAGTSVFYSPRLGLLLREVRGRPRRGGCFGRGDSQQHYTHDYPSDQGNRGLTA